MSGWNRREVLKQLLRAHAALLLFRQAVAAKELKLRIGVTDWNLRQTSQVEAVAMAARLGFDGVEVSLGYDEARQNLRLADPAIQQQYLAAFRQFSITAAGTRVQTLGRRLLDNPEDELAHRHLQQAIEATRNLKTRVILVPNFGQSEIRDEKDMENFARALRRAAPQAERAGVILGLENTLSAEKNARILDAVGSGAVQVYYDVGNSTRRGYNVIREIQWLGRDRICQFHLKDNPHFLGDGTIDFYKILDTILKIDFQGFANLETVPTSGNLEADLQRNLKCIRKIIAFLSQI